MLLEGIVIRDRLSCFGGLWDWLLHLSNWLLVTAELRLRLHWLLLVGELNIKKSCQKEV